MAKVNIEKVTKIYDGGVTAVHQVDLTVQDHEFLVLVGPSGCGKSTLLRMVAGLEEITSGTISIGDRIVNTVAPKDRDIAMVFQDYALYPHMTVAENMAFGLKMRKYPRAEITARVQEAAEILNLQSLLDRIPKQLSGGQRQRVAVGRAIVRKPAVFLFDEPLSNLDAKLRTEMRAEIKKLHQRLRTTTIYVTHDQVEAMTLGDRIVVLRDGLIQQVGAPIELYDHPSNKFVAAFIGTPPMNFLSGRIERHGSKITFSDGHANLQLPDSAATALTGREGRELEIGIRPEKITVHGSSNSGPNMLAAQVEVIEPLGSETLVHFQTPRQKLLSMVDAHCTLQSGETVWLSLPAAQLHVFDCETGRNLTCA